MGIILFLSDDYANLALGLFAVFVKRVSPYSPLSMWGNYYFLPVCLNKDTLLPCLLLVHKHNSLTGVGGNIFFSPTLSPSLSLQKDVTFGVWGKCMRTKVVGSGTFSLQEDFLCPAEDRRERETQLVVQKHFYSWINWTSLPINSPFYHQQMIPKAQSQSQEYQQREFFIFTFTAWFYVRNLQIDSRSILTFLNSTLPIVKAVS